VELEVVCLSRGIDGRAFNWQMKRVIDCRAETIVKDAAISYIKVMLRSDEYTQ